MLNIFNISHDLTTCGAGRENGLLFCQMQNDIYIYFQLQIRSPSKILLACVYGSAEMNMMCTLSSNLNRHTINLHWIEILLGYFWHRTHNYLRESFYWLTSHKTQLPQSVISLTTSDKTQISLRIFILCNEHPQGKFSLTFVWCNTNLTSILCPLVNVWLNTIISENRLPWLTRVWLFTIISSNHFLGLCLTKHNYHIRSIP
jgi:hypothetical protein